MANNNGKDSIKEIEEILSGTVAVQDLPAAVQVQDTPAPVKPGEEPPAPRIDLDWKRKPAEKKKTTVVSCIVIDKLDRWHSNAKVDLKGMDTSAFTWGYYGSNYPVLIEQANGELKPFNLPDAAGESSNRLFKGANPDGFRATFKHRSNLLTKIQVGLMVTLVLGLFFIMFILLNWQGGN